MRNECDPALALLSDYVVHQSNTMRLGAIIGYVRGTMRLGAIIGYVRGTMRLGAIIGYVRVKGILGKQ